jgi:hypothetical protein
MKTGITLMEMAQELERQRGAKRDFLADSRKLVMRDDARSLAMVSGLAENSVAENFEVSEFAQKQLATRLDIPTQFYGRLQQKHPDILSGMVNTLFQREPQKTMLRTLDGRVRAVMSDSYRPLDNYDLFDAIYPALRDSGVQIESCALTETKLYIKALAPWLDRDVPMPEGLVMGQGHTFFVRKVIGALIISNSEIGAGMLSISPGIFEQQCTNLAVFKSDGYGKIHVGKKKGADDQVIEYLSDDTKRLDDAAIWSRARDMVKATLDGRVIDGIVAKLTAARGDVITGNPAKVVELFAKKEGLNEAETGGLLKHFTNSGEASRYGLQWAVTRLAGEVEDYDRASDLERLGGKVIELPRADWTVLAQAA